MKITFLGAVQEVTGSKYLIEHGNTKILIDCGLFQESTIEHKENQFPIAPHTIDAIILTHAHIDHTGYIPALVKNGFTGKIYCSQATYQLCSILLLDTASLMEEHAHVDNATYAQPLYDEIDAKNALKFFHVIAYDTVLNIGSLKATLISSHHILGSSFIKVFDGKKTITFSGDLGSSHQLIIKAPPYTEHTDFLVMESTYGARLHEHGDVIKILGDVIQQTIQRDGVVIIPAFAVMRAQTILYCLYQLKEQKAIPNVPIFLDSPMAIVVSNLLCHFPEELKISESVCKDMLEIAQYTPTVPESKMVDRVHIPRIIIAGSGMAEGGRVVHHLKHLISDAKNTVIFVGYQVENTLGYDLIHGAQHIKIHRNTYDVRAEIKNIDLFSGHADYQEILQWMTHLKNAPEKIFITHGDKESAISLKHKIEEQFGWSTIVPEYLESFDLD